MHAAFETSGEVPIIRKKMYNVRMDFSIYLNRIEKELAHALPCRPDEKWTEGCFGTLFESSDESHIMPLLEPTRSLVDLGGKRWRPLLLVLCAKAMCIREKKSRDDADSIQENAFRLTPLVEFVHTASLIHDDIEDKSETRRGKQAAYLTYGLDVSLNAASWLYFQASTCISALDVEPEMKNKLYGLYTMEVRRLHLGQAMDIKWHNDKYSCPGTGEYLAMVRCKTGTLSSLAAKTGTLVSHADPDLIEKAGSAASKIGAGFQIIDDVINLTTGNPGKKRGDDIVEGKKSLPVLTFLNRVGNQSKEASKLTECFEKASSEGISSPAVEEAIGLLEASGAVDSAAEEGKSLIHEACADFESVFGAENSVTMEIKELFTAMIPKKYLKEESRA